MISNTAGSPGSPTDSVKRWTPFVSIVRANICRVLPRGRGEGSAPRTRFPSDPPPRTSREVHPARPAHRIRSRTACPGTIAAAAANGQEDARRGQTKPAGITPARTTRRAAAWARQMWKYRSCR